MSDQELSQSTPKGGSMGSFIIKALITGVIIVAGVALGIYTGTAMNRSGSLDPEHLRNTSFLKIGDPFPDYALWDDTRGLEYSVSGLVAKGPVLLLFVSHHCPACHTMLKQWEKRVLPELDTNVRLYLVYDEADIATEADPSFVPDLPNVISVTTDRDDQRSVDGIIATPTLVAIGQDGTIRFISSGYVREVDASYIGDHL